MATEQRCREVHEEQLQIYMVSCMLSKCNTYAFFKVLKEKIEAGQLVGEWEVTSTKCPFKLDVDASFSVQLQPDKKKKGVMHIHVVAKRTRALEYTLACDFEYIIAQLCNMYAPHLSYTATFNGNEPEPPVTYDRFEKPKHIPVRFWFNSVISPKLEAMTAPQQAELTDIFERNGWKMLIPDIPMYGLANLTGDDIPPSFTQEHPMSMTVDMISGVDFNDMRILAPHILELRQQVSRFKFKCIENNTPTRMEV